MNMLLWWLLLLLLFFALGHYLGARRVTVMKDKDATPGEPSADKLADLERSVTPLLEVTGRKSKDGVIMFEGRLRARPDEALARLQFLFGPMQLTPLLREGDDNEVRIVLIPVSPPSAPSRPRWAVHALLFALTLATTTWAGALQAGVNLLEQPSRFIVGLPYSLALMLILGAHELGHYFMARRHGVQVTPPYFIPVPFALGTFGAFIKIKSLSPDRRANFDVAIAGPIAGLVFAIPALWFGLGLSTVVPGDAVQQLSHSGMQVGSSVLMALLAKFSLGPAILEGHQLLLHPLAFAGWLGLLVTALNLLPIGQLDGGHIAHSLFGARKGHAISIAGLVALFALSLLVWPGLMMWAFIVWFIAGTRDVPPVNDLTPVNAGRKALGAFAFVLLALILIPVPHGLYPSFGIHCPYL